MSAARFRRKPNIFLRPDDIEAVADYVLAHIKGEGEPNYDECIDFFGNTSRVCDIYKAQQPSGAQTMNKGQSQ